MVSFPHGYDASARRTGDRGAEAPGGARGPIDAGGRPAGRARLHRAHEQARAARSGSRRRAPPLRRGPRTPRPVIYLDLDDLLHVAARTLATVDVRDAGLLESALSRPQSSAFGEDAYLSIHAKAAALLHSL